MPTGHASGRTDRHQASSDHGAEMAGKASLERRGGTEAVQAAPVLGAKASLLAGGAVSRRSAWKSQELVEGNSKSAKQEE